MTDKPITGSAPSESDLSFTITPGTDAFTYTITNTSSVTGIAQWDLGNGIKISGNEVTTKYQVADTYTIKLTLVTNGGFASITEDHVQTETDFSIFTDPVYVNLSGGIDSIEGRTWVIDSTESGHFGISAATVDWPEWWAATPLQKAGGGAYDDEFNFNINDFVFTQINHGDNYVNNAIADQSYYSNPVPVDGADVRVNYASPAPGSWAISDEGGVKYLTLTGATPLFFGFDLGIVNGRHRIDLIEKNLIKLSGIGFDGNRWYYQLIPKGYVKPKLKYDLNVTATGNENEFSIGIANIDLPEGWSISSLEYSFGDGSSNEITNDAAATFTHTYMRANTYVVTVIATANDETFTKTQEVVIASNHSSYVEYLLNAMVMYNDFGETTMLPLTGQDCNVAIVENPDHSLWPNRSNHSASYSKTDQQWANAYFQLQQGYRFDIRQQSIFKILVYGKAGDVVLLKMENTDLGGNAWQTGVELKYTIQQTNKWEIVEYDFDGAATADLSWDPGLVYLMSADVKADVRYNHNYYNVIRIMLNPGNGTGTHSFYFDDLAGPHIEGLK
ncbi:MAG: hypothetical protein HC831_04705 [Chloroflexia bacterium]|nr:hypothetical protein [Chloroflexia bacterium]